MASQLQVQGRVEEACFLIESGLSTPAIAAHLQAKYRIGRTQAYAAIRGADEMLVKSDDGASEEETAAVGADLAPLLDASIRRALATGDYAAVKTLMPCLDRAMAWRGLKGPHSHFREN